MRNRIRGRHRRTAGFSFLGILLVVIIICVLVGYYFGRSPLERTEEQINTYQYTTERARDVVQGENLRVLQQHIDTWALSHGGERCTLEKLRAAGVSIPAPPAGYTYEIDANNRAKLVPAEESHPLSARGVPTSPNAP